MNDTSPPSLEDALLRTPLNPFADSVARLDAGLPPPPDVESLHAAARGELSAAIAGVGHSGRAAMVLVKGDPGQGKTHELTWLRQRARGNYYFLEIPPLKDSGAPFQHILRYAVHGLLIQDLFQRFMWEALRRVAVSVRDAALRDEDQALADRLDQVLLGDEHYIGTFRAIVRDDAELVDALSRYGRALPPLCDLDPDFGRVLCRLPLRAAEAAALDWLRGAELPDEDLLLLRVSRSLDSEAHCFEVLRSLVRISPRPLAFCFDQVESVQGLLGLSGAVALFSALMELYQQLPVCVVLMCQSQVWMDLADHIPLAARERIRELPPLSKPTPADAMNLVAARLLAVWEQAGVSPPYLSYPFSFPYLRAYVDENRPTVRQVLTHCSGVIDEMRRRGVVSELMPAPTQPAIPQPASGPSVAATRPASGPNAASAQPVPDPAAPQPAPDPETAPPARELSNGTAFGLGAALAIEHQRKLRDCDGRADLRIPALRQERLRGMMIQLLRSAAETQQGIAGVKVLYIDAPAKPRNGARPPIIATVQADGTRVPTRAAIEIHSDDARGAVHALERLHGCVSSRAAEVGILLREAEVPVGDNAKKTLSLARGLGPRGGLVYLGTQDAQRLVAADLLLDSVSASEVWAGDRAATRDEALAYLIENEGLLDTLAPLLGRLAPP